MPNDTVSIFRYGFELIDYELNEQVAALGASVRYPHWRFAEYERLKKSCLRHTARSTNRRSTTTLVTPICSKATP